MIAEGLVIVLSILAAFSLDAAWDRLQEREAESAHLLALHRDFLETRARLGETEENESRSADLALRLLGSGPAVPEGELDVALYYLWSVPVFEPVSGALDELIASGELRLIRDEGLRSALAAWGADVESYRRREGWAQDNWNLFRGTVRLARDVAGSARRERVSGGTAQCLSPGSFTPHRRPLLPQPRDTSVITATDVLSSLAQLRARCDEIIERLEASVPRDRS